MKPHVKDDPEKLVPPSDTEEARMPSSTEARWHAGPRDPQLDPVDPIDPANIANPGGAVSFDPSPDPRRPQHPELQRKRAPGMSMAVFMGALIAVLALGAMWMFAVNLK